MQRECSLSSTSFPSMFQNMLLPLLDGSNHFILAPTRPLQFRKFTTHSKMLDLKILTESEGAKPLEISVNLFRTVSNKTKTLHLLVPLFAEIRPSYDEDALSSANAQVLSLGMLSTNVFVFNSDGVFPIWQYSCHRNGFPALRYPHIILYTIDMSFMLLVFVARNLS